MLLEGRSKGSGLAHTAEGSWYLVPSVHALLIPRQHMEQELEGLQTHVPYGMSTGCTAGQSGDMGLSWKALGGTEQLLSWCKEIST